MPDDECIELLSVALSPSLSTFFRSRKEKKMRLKRVVSFTVPYSSTFPNLWSTRVCILLNYINIIKNIMHLLFKNFLSEIKICPCKIREEKGYREGGNGMGQNCSYASKYVLWNI